MAEKRVSVRLVAEGGRQVRAELEGIGEAGARGFGRLSTEMELANTRLASFARKAGIALAAVTVAAAAAGVAMIRSGLQTIGAQADMVEQMSGWTLDTTTGIVTFTTAPANDVIVRAGFEFDVPVRFDSDTLDVTLDFERLGSITSIPLLEIRR